MRGAKKRFPGANDADLYEFIALQVRVGLVNRSSSLTEEELATLVEAELDKAAVEGAQWAANLKNIFRDGTIKPLVEKARAAGADPVPYVKVETGLSEDEIRSMIEALDADAASAVASAPLDESDEDVDSDDLAGFPASVTAQH
jgi:hypothetical protein